VFCVEENEIDSLWQKLLICRSSFLKADRSNAIFRTEDFIQRSADPMFVLIANLNENGACVFEQLLRHRKAISQICQIRVNSIPPGIPKRLHLLRLAGHVLDVAILYIPARR